MTAGDDLETCQFGNGIRLVHTRANLMRDWSLRAQLIVILALGFVIRLAIAPFPGGFGYDVDTFRNWAETLHSYPLDEFYSRADAPDHLPGDLWVMHALGWAFRLFGGENVDGAMFAWCLKLVPAISDVAVAVAIYALVALFSSQADGVRMAGWYILNPVTIFVTAFWGQWDSVSLAILLVGFYLIVKSDPYWILASPFVVWAVLIKPQLAVPAIALIALILFRFLDRGDFSRERLAGFAARGAASLVLGLLTAVAILLPFSVGLPGMDTKWNLVDRLREALDLYPHTTLGAANVWMIPIGSLERIADDSPVVLGLTPNQWGSIGLAVSLIYIVVTVVRAFGRTHRDKAMCWAAAAAVYAIFMVPTRVHERYLFPFIAFSLLYLVLDGHRRLPTRVFWAVSVVFTLNLLLVFGGFRTTLPGSIRWITEGFGFVSLSLLNVALFALFLALPWLHARQGEEA